MNEPFMTISGGLTDDPAIYGAGTDRPYASFSIACTPKRYNRETGEYDSESTIYQKCTVWGRYALNVADSLHRGDHVTAHGYLHGREWEDEDGTVRRSTDLFVDEIGPSLRFATAEVVKPEPPQKAPGRKTVRKKVAA